jgi:hypothetical protein
MAWSGITANQMVSQIDAQTSGFTLQSGQSHGTTTLCYTKADAFAKYVLGVTANTNTLASNQLMRKDFWVTGKSVTFSNVILLTNQSGDRSGTVTITGGPAVFRAFATCFTVGSDVAVAITINGTSRTANRSIQGTTNSTTFTLNPGTYNYSFSCTLSGTGSGGISFTQA